MVAEQHYDLTKDLTDLGKFINNLTGHEIPHKEIFDKLVIQHHKAAAEKVGGGISPHQKTDMEHIQEVVMSLNYLLNEKYEEIITEECLKTETKAETETKKNSLVKLTEIVKKHNQDPDKKRGLLYAALYHDIGKAIMRPRHGPEGADVIRESGYENRRRFYALGLSRSDIYLISELTRFHDYLAMVGTGETSYLTFVEVLHPVSNSVLPFANNFLDYLLLVNLADVVGSIGKIDCMRLNILMQDFNLIRTAHDDISRAVYYDIKKERPAEVIDEVHAETIMARDFTDVARELQRLAANSSAERLRRLLWNALHTAIDDLKRGAYGSKLEEYNNWIREQYKEEYGDTLTGRQKQKPITEWFIEGDVAPILASLRCAEQGDDFYTAFSLICKFDYLLSFLSQIIREMITIEIDKEDTQQRRSPHDMRRDIAMCVVKIICTLVNRYGSLTHDYTRIGLGFERFRELDPNSKKKLLSRLIGEKGMFREGEAYTKLRDSVNIWIVSPCP